MQLLFNPSGDHLVNFLTSRGFLVMIIIYLGSAWRFYSIKSDKERNMLNDWIRRTHKEMNNSRLISEDQNAQQIVGPECGERVSRLD